MVFYIFNDINLNLIRLLFLAEQFIKLKLPFKIVIYEF